MSALQLMDKRGLWTSATWITIRLGTALPNVMRRHRRSPKFGIVSPLATLFDALSHRHSWNNGNAPGHAGRHDGRACAPVDSDLNFHPFMGRRDVADVIPLLLRQLTDVSLRPVKISHDGKRHGFRLVWVPLCVLSGEGSKAPAIISTQW